MITNNSLKEYYVKIQELYDNAVNLLTGINQSLTSQASEITVPILKDNYIESEVRIPSFLYLENKIEELSTNFSNLFNLPNSGDAWLTNNTSQYKLQMIRANTAPLVPEFSTSNIFASITDNNFLKDLVSPKTFLKINIDNLPLGTNSMVMKKIIIHNANLYNALAGRGIESYEELSASLFNYIKGTDYDEYDSQLPMPCRKDKYKSRFEIIDVPTEINGTKNPWVDSSTSKNTYKLTLDTLTYYDKDNSAITFALKIGDYLSLGNSTNLYKVKSVDTSDMSIIIEEYVGHTVIQSYDENSDMVFQIYNGNYKEYDYIQIPLEENQFVIIFLATLYNNVRSQWSKPSFFNLANILIKDEGGNYIDDEFGNHLSYLDYYNKYCTNIGDLILGLTLSAYPQISNFSPLILESLQNGSEIKNLVDNSWDNEETIQVLPINKHLTDDVTSEEIMNLHAQKNEVNAQIQTNQSNIDNVYNKLLTTDFTSQVTITQVGLQEELQKYYSERTTLQKQLNAIIDSINTKSLDVKVIGESVKYRVRGITKTENISEWLHETAGDQVDLISMEVEYKYKSPLKDTNTLTSINQSTFTDWNRQENIDRERKLTFGKTSSNGFGIEYENYTLTNNIIKWNQIDIPINKGEDVVIRIRYKYNIGQPFITLYTPWSEELTVSFPSQYEDDVELTSILKQNDNDTEKAKFNSVLLNEGYTEHIQNKLISNEQTFYHLPENIYSGFNTPENNLVSLKDKLTELNNEIERCKLLLDNESNSKYEIYLSYDETNILLNPNTINKINIYNTDHITSSFIKKKLNIVIKNTGNVRLNLYSIFPGNIDTQLENVTSKYYDRLIKDYERVPVYFNNTLSGQYLGQWIYFRMNNPWTSENFYYDNLGQRTRDLVLLRQHSPTLEYLIDPKEIMKEKNYLPMLGYRGQGDEVTPVDQIRWDTLVWDPIENDYDFKESGYTTITEEDQTIVSHINPEWFIYPLSPANKFINRYEDICGEAIVNNIKRPVYLDENTNIQTFLSEYGPNNFRALEDYLGAFLYPDIISKELVMTEGDNKSSKYIEIGEFLTIPLTFEYFCGDSLESISKTLCFDIRNSLVSDPKHYIIEVIGHNDYTSSSEVYMNYSSGNIDNDNASGAT